MENERILLIDDNPAIHEDYKKILAGSDSLGDAAAKFLAIENDEETQGFELVSAMQGLEGIDLAKEAVASGKPFSVAFVDMRMPPGIDGLETIKRLWEVDPNIQIVICTAYSDHSLQEIRRVLPRIDQFLLLKKPFDSVEVSQLAVALSEKWRLTLQEKAAAAEKAKRLEQTEDSLSQHTLYLELATKIAGTGYCSIDADTKELVASDGLGEILGTDAAAISTLNAFIDLIDPIDRKVIQSLFDETLQKKDGARFTTRACILRPDGESRHLQLSFVFETTIAKKNGSLFGVLHDVTDSVHAMNAVKHAALHDSLTGLANRAKLMDEFDAAIKRSKRSGISTGLVLIDVDHFKTVNDSHGHPTGDELLKGIAQRLVDSVRETDTVSRLGGDEFALVHTSKDILADTMVILDRIYQAFEKPFEIDGKHVYTSLSSGVSLAPVNGLDIEQLIKCADLALYRAKQDGKACFRFFDDELDQKMRERRAIETEFANAIKNNEFELYYQPIVSSSSAYVVCLEGLIRWHHPDLGFVPPNKFIDIAEDSGDIIPIGKWVLQQACRDAFHWPEHVSVAVNVSAVQLRKSDLFETVVDALEWSGLPPDRLEIEVTERILLGNNHGVLDTLNALRDLGVKVVMDDFGIGYSSLSYLQHFRFDKLKLDRSFLVNADKSPESDVIIRAIAGLGRSLDMTTCAEGVETESMFSQVRNQQYAQAQGYLFSKPVPASKLSDLFDKPLTNIVKSSVQP